MVTQNSNNYATGASGTFLGGNGVGVTPTFQSVPTSSSPFTLLHTLTASSSASLAFTSTYVTSTYPVYYVIYNMLKSSAASTQLNLDFSTNNGSTYLSGSYASGTQEVAYNSGGFTGSNSATTNVLKGPNSDFSTWPISGHLYIFGLGVSSNVNGYGQSSGGGTYLLLNGILLGGSAQTVNNIKFSFASGNIVSGTISLYGITQ